MNGLRIDNIELVKKFHVTLFPNVGKEKKEFTFTATFNSFSDMDTTTFKDIVEYIYDNVITCKERHTFENVAIATIKMYLKDIELNYSFDNLKHEDYRLIGSDGNDDLFFITDDDKVVKGYKHFHYVEF